MPTYEYACKTCGEHLEVVQSFKDDPLATCPQCSGELRKVFGAIGIAFKGSGFYKTDSRPAAKGESTSTKSESASTKGDAGSAKGESSGAGGSSSTSSAAKSESASSSAAS